MPFGMVFQNLNMFKVVMVRIYGHHVNKNINMKVAFFILFIFGKLYSQDKIQILNSENNTPVPYVNIWCEKSKFGTSSDENGFFDHSKFNPKDTLTLTSIGFHSKKIIYLNESKTILLSPKIEELKEIVLISEKIKINKINKIKKANYNVGFAENNPINIIAKYFPFNENYSLSPFVNSIEIKTLTGNKNTIINIHIYEATLNGEPGNYLNPENLIFKIEKGNKTTKIDLSNLNLEFPENGLFIGIEVPKIEINEVKESQNIKDFKIFQPLIGMSKVESLKDTWNFKNGKWELNQVFSLALGLNLSN